MVGRKRKISAEWMGKQDTLAYSTKPSGWTASDPGYATRSFVTIDEYLDFKTVRKIFSKVRKSLSTLIEI